MAAVVFPSSSGFDDVIVANNGDGHVALLEGSPEGLILESDIQTLLNPTALALSSFTGGLVEVYAAAAGSEAATLLTFQLGGETGGMPTIPGLQPLHDSALPLIATLLTLTIETSTAEFDLRRDQRRGCRGRFIPTRKYGDCGAKPVGACRHWRE